jgi:hypothetical protein
MTLHATALPRPMTDVLAEINEFRQNLLPVFTALTLLVARPWHASIALRYWSIGWCDLPLVLLPVTAYLSHWLASRHHAAACWLLLLGLAAAHALALPHSLSGLGHTLMLLSVIAASALFSSAQAIAYVVLIAAVDVVAQWAVPVHRHTVIVPVAGLHRGTLKAVEYAQALGGDLHTVSIATDESDSAALADRWQDILPDVPLEVIPSPYRSVLVPLLEYIEGFVKEEGDYVTVVVPEFVPTKWWRRFLHNQTARLLKRELLRRRTGWQGRFRILTNVLFHLTR